MSDVTSERKDKRLGLYLHIPFCRSRCLYCDFCTFPHPKREELAAYTERIRRDLSERSSACRDYVIDSVYFGGGTPTVLCVEELASILKTVQSEYRLTEDAEITVECNPATVDLEYLSALRRAGFNRLSLGVQSAKENELRRLGRRHRFEDFCQTVADARAAGFENISADVMMGIPEQTEESLAETLELICGQGVEHISAYCLSVEEGTPFDRLRERGELPLPDEDEVERMYVQCSDLLLKKGYAQYEISNFARRGYSSRHNLKYWRCEEYLGFGPAAYSDFGGERFGNARDLKGYLAGESIEAERERPDPCERENEYVMLGMRLCEGISAKEFLRRFDEDLEERFGQRLRAYVKDGFVSQTEDGYAFTPKGMCVSNAILSDVLEF